MQPLFPSYAIYLLILASSINLMAAADVEDLIKEIYAANDSTGYASDFKESSFDQVAGIKELEEDFFPHEDLVRLAPEKTSGVCRLQSSGGLLVVAAVSLSAIAVKNRFGIL